MLVLFLTIFHIALFRLQKHFQTTDFHWCLRNFQGPSFILRRVKFTYHPRKYSLCLRYAIAGVFVYLLITAL